MGCSAKCAKITLEVFNILFWLAGGVLLGVSIWVMVDDNAAHMLHVATLDNSQEMLKAAAITLCVVGSVIFVVGFLGCFGAMKESPCLLNTYAVIVVVLLATQITAGILAVVYKDELLGGLSHAMNATVSLQYGQDGHTQETEAWDVMQISFKCCGVNDPLAEWASSKWRTTSGNSSVPNTCCVLVNTGADTPVPTDGAKCTADANNGVTTDMHFYHKGCYNFMYDWAVDHAAILIGVAFGLAGLQILMVALACTLTCEVRNKGVIA